MLNQRSGSAIWVPLRWPSFSKNTNVTGFAIQRDWSALRARLDQLLTSSNGDSDTPTSDAAESEDAWTSSEELQQISYTQAKKSQILTPAEDVVINEPIAVPDMVSDEQVSVVVATKKTSARCAPSVTRIT
uniref:Uncharacterized protein n=1 Tax=Spongospora subterranea TaxID=70186 RepID=A0A0H5RBR8_9EUKA|eukprot:CRZ11473.1 hypothetical protein [Spongospora subterranea]